MTGGLPEFVWVTIAAGTGTYHREATCHAHARTIRVPTIEAAAIRVGLTLCEHCATPRRPPRMVRAASEALAEFAGTFARSA